MSVATIYLLRGSEDTDLYVGSTVRTLRERINTHFRRQNQNHKLARRLRETNKADWSIEVLETLESPTIDELRARELHYQQEYNSIEQGLNELSAAPVARRSIRSRGQRARNVARGAYECKDCDKKFGSGNGLRRHQQTIAHINLVGGNYSPAFKCQVCDKHFINQRNYLGHLGTEQHNRFVRMNRLRDLRELPFSNGE